MSSEETSALTAIVSARCETGSVRERNEDAVWAGTLDRETPMPTTGDPVTVEGERGPLLVVCDGMGGMAAGDVASQLAAETIWREMRAAQASRDREVVARLLRRAVRKANQALRARAREDRELRGMGTTVSAAAVAGHDLVLAQVGDSRAYLFRGQRLTQVTRDQSVVSALVAAGKLTPDEARHSAHRSLVLQALGSEPDVVVSLSFVELRAGDRLLLCSDGLHGVVGDENIAASLRDGSPERGCARLIELAYQAGAPDNVSVVVAEFSGAGLGEPGDEEVQFAELDPAQVGDDAITRTSKVAKRLAAKAGLLDDVDAPSTEVLPATGMYPVLRDVPAKGGASQRPAEPAGERWRSGSRLGLLAWGVAIVLLALALAIILWV